jgi:hypothetical protein
MTEFYKGQRISDLLAQIKELSKALHDNQGAFENETQALRAIEAWTSLTIAKAKLTALSITALSTNEVPSASPRKQQGEK